MPTKKRPTRKLKTGRRTVRTAGMSQSAFAGYGHQAPAQPPATPQTDNKPADGSNQTSEDRSVDTDVDTDDESSNDDTKRASDDT